MLRKFVIHIVLLFICLSLSAQDIHFSDFYSSPLNLNPSLAGLFRGSLRVNAIYRDQYRTVAIPYRTFAFGFDRAKHHLFNSNNSLGYGILVNVDQAGDSHFSTYQLLIPVAIHRKTRGDKITLSGGLGFSFIYNSIDYSALSYPNQFDGDKYNEFMPNSEDFESDQTGYFSLSGGLNFISKPSERQTYTVGISMNNLNTPHYSFDENDVSELKSRFLFHGLSRNKITENLDVIPNLKIQFQGTQQEYQFGVILYQYLNNLRINAINYGVWFRSKDKDAIVLNLGFNISGIQTSLSYDINVSQLSEASNNHGAFEISLIYIYQKSQFRKRTKSVKCPSHL